MDRGSADGRVGGRSGPRGLQARSSAPKIQPASGSRQVRRELPAQISYGTSVNPASNGASKGASKCQLRWNIRAEVLAALPAVLPSGSCPRKHEHAGMLPPTAPSLLPFSSSSPSARLAPASYSLRISPSIRLLPSQDAQVSWRMSPAAAVYGFEQESNRRWRRRRRMFRRGTRKRLGEAVAVA